MKRLLWFALALVPLTASAQDDDRPARGWGLTAGVFLPTSSEMRDLFGRSWVSFGIQPLTFGKPRDWRITGGVSVLTASRNGNRLLAIPATVGVLKEFDQDEDTVPFVAAAAGPTYYDYSLVRGSERFATRRVGWNANARAGVTFSRRLQVQVRYDWYSSSDGFRFDGLSLSVAYQALRF